MKSIWIAAAGLLAMGAVLAKLPAPSDEAKAKAAEAAAKTAHAGKVDAFQLCKAQDKLAARYNKAAKPAAKDAKGAAPAASTCTDPGPFVYPPAAAASAPASAPVVAQAANAKPKK